MGSFLCVHGFADGWPSIFYVFGLVGLVWCVLFMALTADTPKQHRFIGEYEREYILEAVSGTVDGSETVGSMPWMDVIRSKACWAIFCT